MDQFNRTIRQVRNVDQRLIVSAQMIALRPGPFVDYLYADEPQTMEELQNRLASFIRIEEERAHQRGGEEEEPVARAGRDRSDRRTFGRNEKRSSHKGGDQPRAPQYIHHTPLNAPRARVMEEALRANLLMVVRSPTPLGLDESKHYRYHQNKDNTTEDCVTLKDKLESLVQAGNLQKFVQRYKEASLSGAGQLFAQFNHPKRNKKKRENRSKIGVGSDRLEGSLIRYREGSQVVARRCHRENDT